MRKKLLQQTLATMAQLLFFLLLFLLPPAGNKFALAQVASAQVASEKMQESGFIDQLVSLPFFPTRLFLLQEIQQGEVRQFPASAVYADLETHNDILDKKQTLLITAQVPLKQASLPSALFHFAFFMRDNSDSFAATPVRGWTYDKLKQNTQSYEVLRHEVEQLKLALSKEKELFQQIQYRLTDLRDRASQVAGLNEIVDLKMELARLKGFGEESALERQRLQGLIEHGRQLKDPPDIDERRHQLSLHLAQAAQVTAMADRLNKRRQDAAVASVQKKMALARETENIDMAKLAKHVAELRQKRRMLEEALNISSDSGNPQVKDDF